MYAGESSRQILLFSYLGFLFATFKLIMCYAYHELLRAVCHDDNGNLGNQDILMFWEYLIMSIVCKIKFDIENKNICCYKYDLGCTESL